MEDIELAVDENDDLCTSILSRFNNSPQEEHQHICTVIGNMAQGLKEQNLPHTPVAYFGATCSSIDSLSTETESPIHLIEALLTILSIGLPRVPVAILKKKREYLSELLIRLVSCNAQTAGVAASGLKCVSHLLITSDKGSWSDVSQLYGFLLGFMTDSRQKVRRQAHLCIKKVLQSFKETPILAQASEGVTKVFERFLLLAGGSNDTASEGPKGAQEVLHILDALKECLPLMSTKSITSILKYFKTLLELQQPLVTRRIKDSLNVLCVDECTGFPSEMLLDLICFLAISISENEASADGMTFTARLLDVGMKKVFALNRQICVVKLPVVFNALKDILAFEHAEASLAAVEVLKSLINDCIDEALIKQGVEQIKLTENLNGRKSGPTIIEKVCATVESLLDYRYNGVWDISFQVVSALFDKLGGDSFHLLRMTLKSLADMQKLPKEDFPYRKELHECVGSALGAMGPESFLTLVPLKLEAEDLSEVNAWLFPIMKQYIVGARLSFFKESILGMIGVMRRKSQVLKLKGEVFSSRSTDAHVQCLWSLLPSFCNYPIDTAESFSELGKALCSELQEEIDLVGIVCSSVQTLIRQNKLVLDGANDISDAEVSIPRLRAMRHYTSQVAADNMRVLKSSARDFLDVLSRIYLKSTKGAGGCLQSTIKEFASISDKEVITIFFRATMQKLLRVTQGAGKMGKSGKSDSMQIDKYPDKGSLPLARAQLFDLAVSLLPGLNAKEIELLFKAIEPALVDADNLIQKKAYKVLSIILRDCESFLSSKLEQLLGIMIEVLPSCHVSAKRHRLDCLYFLIANISKDESQEKRHDAITSFLTEIILALKEVNKKTRNRAYELLVQIGHVCGDEEKGGKREKLDEFFCMVAGGLFGDSPHMISAAVKGVARLAYEFTDLVSVAFNLLPSSFLLLQRKNKEIIKANLGFLKVLVATSQTEWLQVHLKTMVEGLLKWQDNTKNQFKSKVKLLVEMLVKKCGVEAVKAVMPAEHMKLLTNIRKIAKRKERKSTGSFEENRSLQSKATTSRQSGWNHTNIFSEFGDGATENSDDEYMDANTISSRWSKNASQFKSKASSLRPKGMRKVANSLPEDLVDQLEDEPLDLLDRQKTRSALRSSERQKGSLDSDDEPEIDPEGRLVIREEEGKKAKRAAPSDHPDSDVRSRADSQMSLRSSRIAQKRLKTTGSGWAYAGSEYASKRADGDVKRKGKLEPYAYWPLDRKMMSRRPEHRAAARKGMASVVKLTKKFEGKSATAALSVKGLKFKSKKKSNKRSH